MSFARAEFKGTAEGRTYVEAVDEVRRRHDGWFFDKIEIENKGGWDAGDWPYAERGDYDEDLQKYAYTLTAHRYISDREAVSS